MLLLALTVPLVYFPISTGRYTLSRNQWSADAGSGWLSHELPVWDPAAGALQDEPWLHTIREHLRHGQVVFVNLRNGMGAPFLESLQPGAFYVLNPALLLTFGTGSGFFDFFSLLHVALLVIGLFLLLRSYARTEIAAAVAVLVGFSGATYHNVNMVHFRGYAWLPWMLLGAVGLARRERPLASGLALVIATVGASTAGNVQDFALTLGVVTVIGGAEALLAPGGQRFRVVAAIAAGLCVALAIASPAYVPYLASFARGNLASVGSAAARCLARTPFDFYASWVLPRAQGTLSLPFRQPFPHDQQPDFTTTGFLLLCAGSVLLAVRRLGASGRERALLATLFGLLALFALKVTNVWPFPLCERIPFVNGIRFTKYCLQQVVVAALIVTIAAEHATRLEPEGRRTLLRWALVPFGIAAVTVVWWMAASDHWHLSGDLRSRELRHLLKSWAASIAVVPIFVALVFLRRRPAWIVVSVLFVVQAMLLLPTGFWRPLPRRAVGAEALREGAHPAGARVLSHAFANTNLFFGFEDLAVFDPVLNGSFQRFMTERFPVYHAGFHLQFDSKPEALTPDRLDALRLLGVDLVEMDAVPAAPLRASGLPGLAALDGTLPRAYVVDADSARRAEAACTAGRLGEAVEALGAAARRGPRLTETRGENRVVLTSAGGPTQGTLVLTRAYTSAWRLAGAPPRPLCGVLATWPVSLSGGDRLEVEYRPPGLSLALRIAAAGAAALAVYVAVLWRSSARVERPPAP
jgi:hypothetical protein